MSLTVDQATEAGALAKKIEAVQVGIVGVKDAISGGAMVSSVMVSGALGSTSAISGPTGFVLQGATALSTDDSGAVLNALLAAYENALAAYTDQLAKIGQ